jgi:SWI/SNF-related matrix-associated actin-dependent regulator 1 of chromatin subfamily A
MGLGKTITALAHGVCMGAERWAIFCPASLTANWRAEILAWMPDLPFPPYVVGEGGVKYYKRFGKQYQGGANHPIFISSYDQMDMLANHIEDVIGIDYAIIDEAHYLKNPNALRFKRFFGHWKTEHEDGPKVFLPGFFQRANRTLFLTGTPILNRPAELYGIIDKCFPKHFMWEPYHIKYCNAKKGRFGWDIKGCNEDELPGLANKLSGLGYLARKKCDVLDLPPKIHAYKAISGTFGTLLKEEGNVLESLGISLSDFSLDDLRSSAAKKPKEFASLAAVRKKVGLAKVPVIAEVLGEMLQTGESIVVFAHHHEVSDLLAEKLQAHGVVQIDGRDTGEERGQKVADFQAGTYQLAICGIRSLGVGVTLTKASHMVFCEIDWTPGVLAQAEDRIHRIGQKHTCNYTYYFIANSLDEYILRVVKQKMDMLSKFVPTL